MKDQSERVAIPAVNQYTIQVKVKGVRKSNQEEKWCEEAKVANAQKAELMCGKKRKVGKEDDVGRMLSKEMECGQKRVVGKVGV